MKLNELINNITSEYPIFDDLIDNIRPSSMLFSPLKQRRRLCGRLLPCLVFFVAAFSSSGFTAMAKRMVTTSKQQKPLYMAASSVGDCYNKNGSDERKRKLLPSFSSWYMNQMERHEIATKCLSTGILAAIGDICAQGIGEYLKNGNFFANGVDKLRMMAFFVDGTLCTGPLLHYVYELYEHVYPITINGGDKEKNKSSSVGRALVHVLFDNFVMIVAYISMMMVSTALVEGRYKSISHEFKHDLIPNIKASYKASMFGLMWLQLISFYWLPTNLRVLAVNFIDIIWVVVMSFVTHLHRH